MFYVTEYGLWVFSSDRGDTVTLYHLAKKKKILHVITKSYFDFKTHFSPNTLGHCTVYGKQSILNTWHPSLSSNDSRRYHWNELFPCLAIETNGYVIVWQQYHLRIQSQRQMSFSLYICTFFEHITYITSDLTRYIIEEKKNEKEMILNAILKLWYGVGRDDIGVSFINIVDLVRSVCSFKADSI